MVQVVTIVIVLLLLPTLFGKRDKKIDTEDSAITQI